VTASQKVRSTALQQFFRVLTYACTPEKLLRLVYLNFCLAILLLFARASISSKEELYDRLNGSSLMGGAVFFGEQESVNFTTAPLLIVKYMANTLMCFFVRFYKGTFVVASCTSLN